jgi:hypothetical protein
MVWVLFFSGPKGGSKRGHFGVEKASKVMKIGVISGPSGVPFSGRFLTPKRGAEIRETWVFEGPTAQKGVRMGSRFGSVSGPKRGGSQRRSVLGLLSGSESGPVAGPVLDHFWILSLAGSGGGGRPPPPRPPAGREVRRPGPGRRLPGRRDGGAPHRARSIARRAAPRPVRAAPRRDALRGVVPRLPARHCA